MHRGQVLSAVAAAVVALTVGCSSSPGHPTTLPSLTASATNQSSASGDSDLTQAKAIVRRYYELLNGATTSANAEALAQLMAPHCSCLQVATSTKQVAAKHQHYYGHTSLTKLQAFRDGPGTIQVLASYDYADSGIADANGHVITKTAGKRGASASFRLRQIAEHWVITSLAYLNQGQPL